MRDGFCVWRRGISWHFKIDGSGCLQRKGHWMPFWKNSSSSTFKTRSLGGSHGETASRLIAFLVLVCLPNFVAACRSTNTTPVLTLIGIIVDCTCSPGMECKLELLSVTGLCSKGFWRQQDVWFALCSISTKVMSFAAAF